MFALLSSSVSGYALGGGRTPALKNNLGCDRRHGDVSLCGLLAVVDSKLSPDALRLQTLTLQRLIRHRGPDGSGIHIVNSPTSPGLCSGIAHERLAIVDPLSGNQPLFSDDKTRSLAVNGEIYNHKQLRADMVKRNPAADSWFRTESDCEVIVHLYDEVGVDVASKLDGDFAFVLLDEKTGEVYAARDPIGINSLYMGTGIDGAKWFASEAKPLVTAGCIDVETFPPGHYYSSKTGELTEYYKPAWRDVSAATRTLDLSKVRTCFEKAVEKRLMADVPFGVLLSGGLDSSLVASVIARLRRRRFLEQGDPSDLEPLKSFSIGLDGSPDLAAAKKVADAIGTEHCAHRTIPEPAPCLPCSHAVAVREPHFSTVEGCL